MALVLMDIADTDALIREPLTTRGGMGSHGCTVWASNLEICVWMFHFWFNV